jgi:ABC-type proline/glycine betaine transport system substrate-binding protein
MVRSCFAVLAIAAMVHAGSAAAGERKTDKVVSEAAVRAVSDSTYAELLSQALRKGWRYTPGQIESGYKRHFEEFKLQLIDQGYTIVVGEAGA